MSLAESLTLTVLVLTGIGMPALGVMLSRQDAHRQEVSDRLNERLDHLDGCIDELKLKVSGGTVSRVDLEARMAQLRSEALADTNGLHSRIMRLEDQMLRRGGELK